MIGLFIVGLVLVGAALTLVVRSVALPRLRMTAHLRQIDTYGFDSGDAEGNVGARPPLGWAINSQAERVGRWAIARVGALSPMPTYRLASAGFYSLSREAFHGYRVTSSALLGALVIFEAIATGSNFALGILLAIAAAATCWVLFGASLRHRSETRLHAIDRELPELIDVLTATIEAGVGFAGSLRLVAGRFEGPLGNELKLALQEQSMGLSTHQALENMLERSDTPAMRSFVRAVLQGETLGVSIGQMMRNLAVEMRTRRRQTAQERVQKAPVKMLFPLIILMFPALLIVLLYPAVHQLLQGFSAIGS
ncbi:MAG TPA: type II secretion system F family protein [Solirubrobacteraceae bacterium]|jgi:tight adherence protein C|nr:type II secretion system F family protein [Solirubrobacteraceae bacterium]